MRSIDSGLMCHTGRRTMVPLMSWRRISGMWSPNFGDEQVDQRTAVFVLLARHRLEHLGAGRIFVAQGQSVVGVDAAVLLFVADREREQFALRKLVEATHSKPPPAAMQPLRRRVASGLKLAAGDNRA